MPESAWEGLVAPSLCLHHRSVSCVPPAPRAHSWCPLFPLKPADVHASADVGRFTASRWRAEVSGPLLPPSRHPPHPAAFTSSTFPKGSSSSHPCPSSDLPTPPPTWVVTVGQQISPTPLQPGPYSPVPLGGRICRLLCSESAGRLADWPPGLVSHSPLYDSHSAHLKMVCSPDRTVSSTFSVSFHVSSLFLVKNSQGLRFDATSGCRLAVTGTQETPGSETKDLFTAGQVTRASRLLQLSLSCALSGCRAAPGEHCAHARWTRGTHVVDTRHTREPRIRKLNLFKKMTSELERRLPWEETISSKVKDWGEKSTLFPRGRNDLALPRLLKCS